MGAEQVGVAPGRTLGEIAQLLVGVGEQRPRIDIAGLGEHDGVQHLRDEPELARVEVAFRARKHH